jgi:hypothetical protein
MTKKTWTKSKEKKSLMVDLKNYRACIKIEKERGNKGEEKRNGCR